jgi:streptogramin lyase
METYRYFTSRVALIVMVLAILMSFHSPVHSTSPKIPPMPVSDLSDEPPVPLPRGCGGVTPPGGSIATCCLNGRVYVDGEAVAGADVIITSPRGDRFSTVTRIISVASGSPYYELNLNSAPLNIQPGETITITVRFGQRERTLTYITQPGSQQVDIVFPRRHVSDYVIIQSFPLRDEPGRFDGASGIAVSANGTIFVVEQEGHQVQVFDRTETPVRQWGRYGRIEGQFNRPARVVIDPTQNVYILDVGNRRIQKFDQQGNRVSLWSLCPNVEQCPLANDMAMTPDGDIAVVYDRGVSFFSTAGTLRRQWQWPTSLNLNGSGIAVDRNNNVYITGGFDKIYKFALNGSLIGVISTSLSHIQNIAVDGDNKLWVTDPTIGVARLSASGTLERQWSVAGAVFTDLTVAADGRLYLTSFDNKVTIVDPTTNQIRSWGAASRYRDIVGMVVVSATGVLIANRDPALVARLDNQQITHLQLDPPPQKIIDMTRGLDGWIYILDQLSLTSGRVYQLDANGAQRSSFAFTNVTAGAIAVAANGTIFLTDKQDGKVVSFLSNGQRQSEWRDDRIFLPVDLAIDANGYVYVADAGLNNFSRIHKFTANGNHAGTLAITFDPLTDDVLHVFESNVYVYNASALHIRPDTLANSPATTIDLDGPVSGWDIATNGNIYTFSPNTKQVLIFQPMRYTQPIATITHVNLSSLEGSDTLIVRGMAQDSDESDSIVEWRWTSNLDGTIGNQPVLEIPANRLQSGMHRISLSVRDNENEQATSESISVFVVPQPQSLPAWTILLYLNADDREGGQNILASYNRALEELRSLASRNPTIRVAALVDGPGANDTYRVLIPGQTEHFAEQQMDDPATLRSFLRWGQSQFPARHYYLAIADHGQGVKGISWDSTSDYLDDGVSNESAFLTVKELGEVLNTEDILPIDVIHLDACSMGLLEVAYELRPRSEVPPRSRFLISSQYLGWSFFAYEDYFANISANTTPETVARTVVERYAVRSSSFSVPFTITALDLGRVPTVAQAVSRLARELAAYANNRVVQQNHLNDIRNRSVHIESNGNRINDPEDAYLDLLSWVRIIRNEIQDQAIRQRATELIDELTGAQSFILPDGHRAGSGFLTSESGAPYVDMTDVNGISIFYPYQKGDVFNRYTQHRLFQFTRNTAWNEFLTAGIVPLNPGSEPDERLGPLSMLPVFYNVYVPAVIR